MHMLRRVDGDSRSSTSCVPLGYQHWTGDRYKSGVCIIQGQAVQRSSVLHCCCFCRGGFAGDVAWHGAF